MSFNFFDTIKCLYLKDKRLMPEVIDTQLCLTLNKWLSFDKNNIQIVKKLIPLVYFIEPRHYFYLLYFNIPRQYKVPFLKKPVKNEEKKNLQYEVYQKIRYVLGWSQRELKINKEILDRTIDVNYWKKELGVTGVK